MTSRKAYWIGAAIGATALTLGATGTTQAAYNVNMGVTNHSVLEFGKNTLSIGWTSWADAKFMAQLVKQQIESHTKFDVYLAKATIGVQYKAVANGDLDAMIMAWLPDTHKSYWKQVHNDVIDLGPMYTGAVIGWAVPDYVPKDKVNSIADLKKDGVARMFDNAIQGIDPGAGEMKLSAKALQEYGLEGTYKLKEASGPSMTKALGNAIRRSQPIMVTLWTPHWAFGKWYVRFLKDPKHVFGGPQHVDVLARKGIRKDHPVVAKFLSHLHIPLHELQDAMYVAEQTDEKTAVANFVKKHQALVKSWWFGTGVENTGGSGDADTASSS
jgi:glycine betaine/proline transport system substrate-binding protein